MYTKQSALLCDRAPCAPRTATAATSGNIETIVTVCVGCDSLTAGTSTERLRGGSWLNVPPVPVIHTDGDWHVRPASPELLAGGITAHGRRPMCVITIFLFAAHTADAGMRAHAQGRGHGDVWATTDPRLLSADRDTVKLRRVKKSYYHWRKKMLSNENIIDYIDSYNTLLDCHFKIDFDLLSSLSS